MPLCPENLVEVATFQDEETAHDYGLVVLSQGCGYWVIETDEGGFGLWVEEGYAQRLRREMEKYAEESAHWPPDAPEMPEAHPGSYAAMSWMATLVLSWLTQQRWPEVVAWGRVSSDLIQEGQFYRGLTALFLHSDIGHLIGNLAFGAIFVHLVARHIGTLPCWLGVLVAGTAGNLLNASFYFEASHYSIGASTAVFGAVGLLVALPIGFALRHARRQLFRAWFLPVVVGLALLAWFGTGSGRTDTTAHLAGFVCGLPLGVIGGLRMRQR